MSNRQERMEWIREALIHSFKKASSLARRCMQLCLNPDGWESLASPQPIPEHVIRNILAITDVDMMVSPCLGAASTTLELIRGFLI